MRPKIREILEECIETGMVSGYRRAHKHHDDPSENIVFGEIEDAIWLEIDQRFDFDRNVCNEVVEGFDHLEKEREWVGLTHDEILDSLAPSYEYVEKEFFSIVRSLEAKLKEKNT